ncbi:MAG: monovalent cation/H+ antiporter subunit D family protein [Betaproteobacteria bacterium]|nr:monovalent cation/H+ antiporter subunit D family protein [Betaproteobacteria bacterium]
MNGVEHLLSGLALPVVGAAGVAVFRYLPNLREGVSLLTAGALFFCVASLVPSVLEGARPGFELLEVMPGLQIAFRVEPLGMLFALVASGLWIVSSLYSIGYMRANGEANQTRFYVCFALALAATIGIAFSANAFTLFIFYEALTLVTYPLVTHHGTDGARNGGRTYLAVLIGTSVVFLLPALVFTWHTTGTTDFRAGGILAGKLDPVPMAALLALYMFGIGKAALMPFHRWLPAAMVAPAPVSALLHAVAVVKAGVFSVVKVVVYLFGTEALGNGVPTDWLIAISGFTILAASVVALNADNLKRRLAYSTISQLSYIVLAVAVLAPLSMIGAVLHIAAHALGKITLFFAAGAIYTASHKTEVSELDGIGRRMPWTMGAFAIGALSLIGIPPAAGFFSKWYMVQGAAASESWVALAVLATSTLLNAAYFLPVIYSAFFRTERVAPRHDHGEAPATSVAALVITAAATLALPFAGGIPLELARAVWGGS